MSAIPQQIPIPLRPVQQSSGAEDRPPLVLVVDPDDGSRATLELVLGREGFQVVSVTSAPEALRELLGPGRPLPDAVVVESRLDGPDGFDLCGQLRIETRTAQLPVLLLGRQPENFHGEMASHAGADEYLARPIFGRDVAALVRLATAAPSPEGALRLSTSQLPLPQLLRALLAGVRSGRVEVKERKGQLAFRRGRVIDASFGSLEGREALTRMLLLAEGEYEVRFGPSLGAGSISLNLKELVSGVFPRLLRWQSLLARSLPLEAVLAVDFPQLAQALEGLPDGVNPILRLFDGRRTVREVLMDSEAPETSALEVATRLYSLGVIAPWPRPEEQGHLPLSAPPLFQPALGDSLALSQAPAGELLLPQEEPEASSLAVSEVEAFARGQELEQGASLAQAVQRQPIALTEVAFEPDPLPQPRASAAPKLLAAGVLAVVAVALAAFSLIGGGTSAEAPQLAWEVSEPKVAAPPQAPLAPPPAPVQAPGPTLEQGLALYSSGRAKEAAVLLDQVVERKPDHVAAWVLLGLSRFDSGRVAEAESAALKALSLDAQNGRATMLLASIYLDAGQRKKGEVELRRYLQLEPDGPFAEEARQLLSSR